MPLSRVFLLFIPFFCATPVWSQWKPWNDLPPHCSHVIVLRGEEDRHLAEGVQWGEDVRLMYPGPRALAATKEALARMTPLMCQSVRRIAFGSYREKPDTTGAVNSYGAGDLVLINLAHKRFYEEELEKRSSSLMLQETLLHEAAHSAETLLGAESKDGGPSLGLKKYGGAWSMEARRLARETIERVRLENGLHNEWQRLHRSFVSNRWGQRYNNDAYVRVMEPLREVLEKPRWANATSKTVAEAGFMNTYGAVNWAEDFATFVSNVYIGPEMATGIRGAELSEDLRQDMACREMQSQKEENVPARLAAVYTKLMFLADVGLIQEESVAECMGSMFGLIDVGGPGFHFFEKGQFRRSFENKVEAGMGTSGTWKVFEMRSEGRAMFGDKSYPASIKLSLGVGTGSLETTSWPRGIYKLGLIGPNKLALRLDGAQAGNFDAKEGYVLVASSSGKLIEGSIFLTQAWRAQAPLPVPQVFDPPLHIRFQLKK